MKLLTDVCREVGWPFWTDGRLCYQLSPHLNGLAVWTLYQRRPGRMHSPRKIGEFEAICVIREHLRCYLAIRNAYVMPYTGPTGKCPQTWSCKAAGKAAPLNGYRKPRQGGILMDIIVTTPKAQMAAAAKEAADCILNGGGEYFRRFHSRTYPTDMHVGDRVYYVEDGYIRGFAVVKHMLHSPEGRTCDTTGRVWSQGFFVFMDSASWQWIKPIPMKGFQGFRYVYYGEAQRVTLEKADINGWRQFAPVIVVGGWKDPKPEAGS